MLQLVGQRGEEGVEQQAGPPGDLLVQVEQGGAEHAGQGEGEDAGAEGVLVAEQRVALAQRVAMGHHHFTNMR
ncbi:hypothetical protein D3C75_1358750 [compost metagenome]